MPHVRDGFTQIANEIVDEVFIKGNFSKRESQIIWIILRESWGWEDKREKTIKRYNHQKRKYEITRHAIYYSEFSQRSGIALPHIAGIITGLKERKVLGEHWGYYKFNKNYNSYQKGNLGYQKGNLSEDSSKTESQPLVFLGYQKGNLPIGYQKGNKRLPKRSLKVTKKVTSTPSKPKPTADSRALKERNKYKEIKTIVEFLNSTVQRSFKWQTKETQQLIRGRLAEGYSIEDFKTVIEYKKDKWTGTDQEEYLQPSTLFRPTNFENYLQQAKKDKKKERIL